MRKHMTDTELTQAARQVREAMLSSLAADDTDDFTVSETFLHDMNNIAEKTRRHRKTAKLVHQIAAVFAVVLLSTTVLLSVNVQARTTLIAWIREQYEQSFIYNFFNNKAAERNSDYAPIWLPEGYTLTSSTNLDAIYSQVYSNGEDKISFDYLYTSDGAQGAVLTDIPPIQVKISNIAGDFYESTSELEMNELVWYDEGSGILFTLSSFQDQQIMIKIAESVTAQ